MKSPDEQTLREPKAPTQENQVTDAPAWWRGAQGEYWVVGQGIALLGFAVLPVYPNLGIDLTATPWLYFRWAGLIGFGAIAAVFLFKGVLDLGKSLTPLPYPVEEGQFVQTGVYGVVRHPLYSGLILAALGWSLYWLSGAHFLGAIALLLFFDAKARTEESWLLQKYPEYADYRQRVKKLLPWIY